MKEIVEWLSMIERMSNDFYGSAARLFGQDRDFSDFLNRLASDEQWHDEVIHRAGQHLHDPARAAPPCEVTLDRETRERVEGPFRQNAPRLCDGTLTKDAVIECIIATEFSEWNDIFLYVVNSMKGIGQDFEPAAASIQQHKRFIEAYLEKLPAARGLDRLRNLRPLWHERILIVDDSPPVREFLAALLSTMGAVDQAGNGHEGLHKVLARHYDVIVSDVDMPVMDGPAFCREALKADPRIGTRFLFLAGSPPAEAVAFFRQHDLHYLAKPAPIHEIAAAVESILLLARGPGPLAS